VPGGEDGPKARQHHIKGRVRNRQILGVPDFELDVHAGLDRSLACVVEPGVGDVDPEDVPSGLGGGHRDGAGTRGNVKNALARGHGRPVHQHAGGAFEQAPDRPVVALLPDLPLGALELLKSHSCPFGRLLVFRSYRAKGAKRLPRVV